MGKLSLQFKARSEKILACRLDAAYAAKCIKFHKLLLELGVRNTISLSSVFSPEVNSVNKMKDGPNNV